MGLIKYLFGRSWRAMSFVSLTALVGGLAGAALVAVIGKAVVAQGDRTWLGVTFLGLCVLIVVTRALSEVGLLRLTQDMVLHLRLNLSRKLLATPQKRLSAIGRDELMVIVTRDIDVFSNAFQVFPRVFSNLIVLVACLGYVAVLSWSVFFVVVVCMVLCVGGYMLAERAPLRQLSMARDQTERVQRALRTLIEGSRELQLNVGRTRHFLKSVLEKEARSYAALYTSSMARYAWTSNIGNVLFFQGIGVVLFIVPLFMPGISAQAAELTLVLLYNIRPIGDLMFSVPPMRQASISWNRVRQLEGTLADEETKLQEPDPFGDGIHSLELRDVCHRYQAESDDRFILGPISVDIRCGEILFIIGGNGTGKTTLAMLLLGLFEPESGHIALNGVTVTDENRDNYRQRFSAIFSDGHLFEHLPVADDEASAAAARYLRALHLPESVRISDGKFSTVHLSMGQRKRLALVSSYLEDRPIYVFDEWAADQDPMFKKVFYSQIAPDLKTRGKTIIIISHDDAYFGYADRTIKLDAGRLHAVAA